MAAKAMLQDRFEVKRMPMICGSAEAEGRLGYKMVTDGKGCVWMYSLEDKSPSSTVYYHDPNDERSDGFGGRVITFKIGKCAEYQAKGPWHSNSDSLFDATGIDLRDKCLTFGAVSRERVSAGPPAYNQVLQGLLYVDDEPMLGTFDRIKTLAQQFADSLDIEVYYYSETSGGSSCGPIYPTGKSPWELKEKQERRQK
jgi:hypothetical protein